ncbi:MAG: glycosyltransferase family 39 protein [Candidatus Rokubacteria bacterium]|nr:glycosyltransferase family 39 protein [Candidatus Rokubacteria bacterium]
MNESSKPTSVVSQALVVLTGALVAYVAWASLPWPLVHDAPIMHYVAWRIADGAVPYRDLFDMNFPGVYLIHLAVVTVMGTGDFGWRLFDLAWLAATCLVIARLARPWGRAAATGGALLFALYHLAGGPWQAGQRDFLLCVFLLLGALGVARWADGAGARDLAWAGLALGAGVTIKPHAVLLAAGLAGFVAVRGRQRGASVRGLVTFVAAAAVAPAGVVAWIGLAGGLGAWRQIVFGYVLPLYSHLAGPDAWRIYRPEAWGPIALVLVVTVVWAVRSGRVGPDHVVALIGVGYGVVHYVIQGKGWEYHLYPLAAFASVLAFSAVEPALRLRRHAFAVALAAGLAAVVVLLGLKAHEAAGDGAQWWWDKERLVRLLVSDLEAALHPHDTVQVLDTSEGGIHALLRLGVVEPTRFLYDFHFYHDVSAPEIQRLRAELVRGMDARAPRFVVLLDRGWPSGGPDRVADFPELSQRLATTYRVVARRPGYQIFARRTDS